MCDNTSIDFWSDISFQDNNLLNFIRLSSILKSISDFVSILTNKNIPVKFYNKDDNSLLRDTVYIPSNIDSKFDFESAIGMALHKGGHILLTDWDLFDGLWANIPPDIIQLSDKKGYNREELEKYIIQFWHIVEDRFIDNYIFSNLPGYRQYYISFYNKYWNSSAINEFLKSDEYKYTTFDSYLFRIGNFCNSNTDLTALPRLDDIADVFNIKNIHTLINPKQRVQCMFDILRIVLDCIDDKTKFNAVPDRSDDYGLKVIQDMVENIENKFENKPIEASSNNQNGLNIATNNIKNFLSEEYDGIEKIDSDENVMISTFQKSHCSIKDVGDGVVPNNLKIKCIVVKKLTSDLIFNGNDMFPLTYMSQFSLDRTPKNDKLEAVNFGMKLGTILGKKLKCKVESKNIKINRQKKGKLEKRHIHELGFDSENVFFNTISICLQKTNLHISLDGSSSMRGEKWEKSITTIVAICKAAELIGNIHITVSIRTTLSENNNNFPYIILVYDSKKDTTQKIKHLFPYLEPNGYTPEGLTFEAIMDLFLSISPDEKQKYILNISDGMPYLNYNDQTKAFFYKGLPSRIHTKKQMNKLKRRGFKILSYFVADEDIKEKTDENLKKNFQFMYGKSAKFIDVNGIIPLTLTLNELLKDSSKRS